MTDHDPDHDDVLKELDAALDVEPSGAFADGVRAWVTRSHTRNRNMWLGLAAAASLGLATMALWRPSVEAPAMMAVAPAQASAPAVASAQSDRVVPDTALMPIQGQPVAKVARTTVARAAVLTTSASTGPRLEVITNQGAVLRQLWADYQGRPLVVAEGEPVVEGLSTKAIAVETIEVRLLVVSEIGKEPGPAGATPIIRRANATKETR